MANGFSGFVESIKILFQGPSGPPGPPGPQGEPGKRGNDVTPGPDGAANPQGGTVITELIKLPVDVVLVSPVWDPNRIMDIRRALDQVRDFWAEINIDIQPNVCWFEADESILDYNGPDFSEAHYHRGGARLAFYIGSNLDALPNTPGHVGQMATKIGPYGSFLIAGAFGGISEPGNFLKEVIDHEMGHLLLTGNVSDHEAGTFMQEGISKLGNNITGAQAATARISAYEWGGY